VPVLFAALLSGPASSWYDPATGALLFPFKTLAAFAGVVCLPVVSRLTARWDPPRKLRNAGTDAEPVEGRQAAGAEGR